MLNFFDCSTRWQNLYWYTKENQRYPTPAEKIQLGRMHVIRERDQANRLAAKLRGLGNNRAMTRGVGGNFRSCKSSIK